ncbi:hypothetical protein RGU12_05410 [Fredinandcohnia sp. QZ13]|uniref:hypothetical protein n=1 Tax=Fredinandcohnia sp. QZ13 TaxID=3073144 RepID=UPI002853727D|nr:hypothetical protein [Fredinandcohnia sp. QZ13]MDR4886990.1 hypothetical protein [Fredinandcohnia sp. QZ13]
MENVTFQFIRSVDEAEKAVIESQGNDDLERFQYAQNILLLAKEQLREVENSGETENKDFHRAKERLRRLEETQHAIEGTNKY